MSGLLARIEAICKPRVLPDGLPLGVQAYLRPNLSVILDGRAEIEAVVSCLHALAEREDWLNIVDVSFVRCFHTSNQQAAAAAKDDENDAGCPAYHYIHNDIHYVAIVNS